jgi:hypothetical protein
MRCHLWHAAPGVACRLAPSRRPLPPMRCPPTRPLRAMRMRALGRTLHRCTAVVPAAALRWSAWRVRRRWPRCWLGSEAVRGGRSSWRNGRHGLGDPACSMQLLALLATRRPSLAPVSGAPYSAWSSDLGETDLRVLLVGPEGASAAAPRAMEQLHGLLPTTRGSTAMHAVRSTRFSSAPFTYASCHASPGDFTPEELELISAAGALPVGLGRNRLRCETAAMGLLAAAMLLG